MFGGETDEHALTRAATPLWDGFAILKMRIKYIDGAAKRMGTAKVIVIGACTGPKFFRGEATEGLFRRSIVDPDGIVHRESPEIQIAPLGPVNLEMNQVGTGHPADSTNTAFGNSILMVSTDTTETKGLVQTTAVVLECFCTEDSVIRMIMLD